MKNPETRIFNDKNNTRASKEKTKSHDASIYGASYLHQKERPQNLRIASRHKGSPELENLRYAWDEKDRERERGNYGARRKSHRSCALVKNSRAYRRVEPFSRALHLANQAID